MKKLLFLTLGLQNSPFCLKNPNISLDISSETIAALWAILIRYGKTNDDGNLVYYSEKEQLELTFFRKEATSYFSVKLDGRNNKRMRSVELNNGCIFQLSPRLSTKLLQSKIKSIQQTESWVPSPSLVQALILSLEIKQVTLSGFFVIEYLASGSIPLPILLLDLKNREGSIYKHLVTLKLVDTTNSKNPWLFSVVKHSENTLDNKTEITLVLAREPCLN